MFLPASLVFPQRLWYYTQYTWCPRHFCWAWHPRTFALLSQLWHTHEFLQSHIKQPGYDTLDFPCPSSLSNSFYWKSHWHCHTGWNAWESSIPSWCWPAATDVHTSIFAAFFDPIHTILPTVFPQLSFSKHGRLYSVQEVFSHCSRCISWWARSDSTSGPWEPLPQWGRMLLKVGKEGTVDTGHASQCTKYSAVWQIHDHIFICSGCRAKAQWVDPLCSSSWENMTQNFLMILRWAWWRHFPRILTQWTFIWWRLTNLSAGAGFKNISVILIFYLLTTNFQHLVLDGCIMYHDLSSVALSVCDLKLYHCSLSLVAWK